MVVGLRRPLAHLSVWLGALRLLESVSGVEAGPADFDWSTVEPSASLNYTACFDGHKCAKLLVPLDWLDPENPARATIAIITLPAVVDETDPSFGGTIITNPGGPGGPGVNFLLGGGSTLQHIADGDKKYEILSFDPRGIGHTTPTVDCHRDEFARATWKLEDRAIGPMDAGVDVVRRKAARAVAFGQLCEAGDDVRRFVSTPSVARDMVEIVDQIHKLRKGSTTTDLGLTDDIQQSVELRSAEDLPRIQYWGFSYGSVLGQYFASMFPGRVGRMIIEGIEDVQDYANATWVLNLPDTQDAFKYLSQTCYVAGPRCALYKATDTSPDDIHHRVRRLLDDLEAAPAPLVWQNTVVSITKQDVIKTIFLGLYEPIGSFPRVATVLSAAMDGNFTDLYLGLHNPSSEDSCPLRLPSTYSWMKDAQNAIACGDGESQADLTVASFMDHVARLKHDSPDFGEYWSTHRLDCRGWRVRAKYRFEGPWVTPEPDSSIVEGKPAAPLLIISSKTDPVTPLRNAHEAAKSHPGSRVLVQDNVGHCAVTTPSECTKKHVNRYFETGELPKEGTLCASDCQPFMECPKSAVTAMSDDVPGRLFRERYGPLGLF